MATIAAIDAALNHSGFVIHDGSGFRDYGVLTVDRDLPLADKLLVISQWVSDLVLRHGVDEVVIEGSYVARNAWTSYQLALVHGVIMVAARARGARIAVIAPARVKRAITGRGNASKNEVAAAVARVYSGAFIYKGVHIDDVTDAFAIYHAYVQDTARGKDDAGRVAKAKKRAL